MKYLISYNLDGVAGYEFTRVIDSKQDTLLRNIGYVLRHASPPPGSGDLAPEVEAQATYQYSPTDGRFSTIR